LLAIKKEGKANNIPRPAKHQQTILIEDNT
jgi:hypothetical protein